MKIIKFSLLLILTFLPVSIYSQYIINAEYFFDNDPGLSNGIPVTIVAGDSVNILDSINVSSLTTGLHFITIRYKDSSGVWSHNTSKMFFVMDLPDVNEIVENSYPIIQAEYFIDTDQGVGNGVPILSENPVDSLNILDSIQVSELNTGLHYFTIRYKDSFGKWSHSQSKPFFVMNFPDVNEVVENPYPIIQAEYFIDTDPGVGNGVAIFSEIPVDNFNILDSIQVSELNTGLHYLTIRYKDSFGKWSHSQSKPFFTMNLPDVNEVVENPYPIIHAEYFIDEDPGIGNGIAIISEEPVNIMNIVDSIAVSLEVGQHSLTIRYKDSFGKWSHSETKQFVISETPPLVVDGLVAYYPFNNNTIDESYNGNNGTPFALIPAVDRFGNNNRAYYFDGDFSRIVVPDSPTLDIQNSISLLAWIKTNYPSSGDIEGHIISKHCTNWSRAYSLFANSGESSIGDSLGMELIDQNNEYYRYLYYADTNNVYDNNWHLIAATYNKETSTANVYIDGRLKSSFQTQQYDLMQIDYPLTIGCFHLDAGVYRGFFHGAIDDISIYNRALNPAEIALQFLGDTTLFAPILMSPINNETDVLLNLQLNWFPVNYATAYTVQVSTTNDFSSLILDEETNGTTINLSNLDDGTLYFWRVCASNFFKTSNWSEVWSFRTEYQQQIIFLNNGWNTISSFFLPETPNMFDIFAEISSNIRIVKNDVGELFVPEWGINTIGNWNPSKGYLVYTINQSLLTIEGLPINPSDYPINLNAGWQLVSYLRNSPMSAPTALSSIVNSLIFAKNNGGFIYHPIYGINTLGDFIPGQGYWLYMSAPAVLIYPGN